MAQSAGGDDQALNLLLREFRLLNVPEHYEANAAIDHAGEVGLGGNVGAQGLCRPPSFWNIRSMTG